MLQLQHVNKVYMAASVNEHSLFREFSLEIDDGEFVSIIGSNGSGKTSLLNIICGSTKLDQGQIILNGKTLNPLPEHRRQRFIARVFQDPAKGTAADMTILENLSIAANKHKRFNWRAGINQAERHLFQEKLATLGMGLENRLDQNCGSLSGGQRQALSLLMATLGKPELLILDEHTAALDPRSSERIMEITASIVKRLNVKTLMVTHNLRHALEYGNRLLMMHEGQVILDKKHEAKEVLQLDELLDRFNHISIEYGNSV